MTSGEFAFLAMGLVLGIAAGAALISFLRARPPVPREVRVTVAQDAIPRRAATLADDAFVSTTAEAATGGPADPTEVGGHARPDPLPAPAASAGARPIPSVLRTPVRTAGPAPGSTSLAADRERTSDPVGVPVEGGADPLLTALRASAAASAVAAMAGGPGGGGRAVATGTMAADAASAARLPTSGQSATAAATGGGGSVAASAGDGPPGSSSLPRTASAGPCAEQRRLADERCELAVRARAGAASAEERLRAAQRDYDDHEARADRAAAAADPRAVRRAKDEAQARFRSARLAAATTDAVEAAARDWLLEINRINAESRDAATVAAREHEAVRTLTLELERIGLEAEAARIAAETAEAACLAAREAVADCEEAAAAAPVGAPPPPATTPAGRPDTGPPGEDEPLAAAFGSGGTPRIFRLVRGERAAMIELVDAMAGDDPAARRQWQLALSDLLDAILADSIAAASLHFPEGHPFWGPFTLAQSRDIAQALSSLGYRFDGLGGWVDGRVPSQRDLSLALGYAGLDPMRIRHWPTESEMQELYAEVSVAADERLAGAAGDLTLGELVSMLGRRADGLAEVWNHWGTLRPLLLEER